MVITRAIRELITAPRKRSSRGRNGIPSRRCAKARWRRRSPARDEFDAIDRETQAWLEDAVEFGRVSPEPDPETALDFVW